MQKKEVGRVTQAARNDNVDNEGSGECRTVVLQGAVTRGWGGGIWLAPYTFGHHVPFDNKVINSISFSARSQSREKRLVASSCLPVRMRNLGPNEI